MGCKQTHDQLGAVLPILLGHAGRLSFEDFRLVVRRWEMLADMQRHGITVGAHTRTHPVLTNETPTVVSEETAGSRKHLESRLGVAVHHFAYPDGGFDRTAVKAVAAAGYRLAFTACRHRDSDYPGLTLPRTLLWERSSVDAWQRFSASILSCQLRGMFDVVRSCRRPHGGAD